VSHGRYVIFQMAEVAIARQMFQEILRLIAELWPQPPPALALRRLALLLSVIDQSEEAETLLRRALAIHERELGVDHPIVSEEREQLESISNQKGETAKSDLFQLIGKIGRRAEVRSIFLSEIGNQKGETEKALADYTRVIEQLPGAPVEQVAAALVNRGATWGQKGETEKALADFTRVVEQLPGAPVEEVAKALGARGWMRYLKDDFLAFLTDTEAALNKPPIFGFCCLQSGTGIAGSRTRCRRASGLSAPWGAVSRVN
jgi:tetratricopeptide (TPR) repeat protein